MEDLIGKGLAKGAELAIGVAVEYAIDKIPAVRRARAERMFADIAEYLDLKPEVLAKVLRSNDLLCELVVVAAEAAANSRLEAKIPLLAKAVSESIVPGAEKLNLDAAYLRVSTLRDLEETHIMVLRAVAEGQHGTMRGNELRQEFQNNVALDAVLSVLTRHGVLFVADSLTGFSPPVYRLTDYGRFILASLQDIEVAT